MNCPKHPDVKLMKVRLDVYGCRECGKVWLIHRLPEDYVVPTNVKQSDEK